MRQLTKSDLANLPEGPLSVFMEASKIMDDGPPRVIVAMENQLLVKRHNNGENVLFDPLLDYKLSWPKYDLDLDVSESGDMVFGDNLLKVYVR